MTRRLPGTGREMRVGRELPTREIDEGDDHELFGLGDQGKSMIAAAAAAGTATGTRAAARRVIQSQGSGRRSIAHTVFLDEPRREDNQPIDATDDANLVAIVRWGTNGVSHEAEVDVVRGGRLTVVGSEVDVQILQEVGVNGGRTPRNYRVAATAGYIPNASPVEPTRTVLVPAVGGGMTSAMLPIPPFARAVTFYRQPQTAAVVVEFFDAGSTALYAENVAANATCPKILLAQDVRLVRITATGAIAGGRLVFSLAI